MAATTASPSSSSLPSPSPEDNDNNMITILGFGSLLSEKSSRTTFPTLQNFRLGRVPNYRRVFRHPASIFFHRGIANLNTLEISSLCAEPVLDDDDHKSNDNNNESDNVNDDDDNENKTNKRRVDNKILIHCLHGKTRSAAIAACIVAILSREGHFRHAYEQIRQHRNVFIPQEWHTELQQAITELA